MSIGLHGHSALEGTVNIDTGVQEKAITYPTDSKLAIKIINRLNKLAKTQGIQQRRTNVKEVKNCRLRLRHFRHVKKRSKAKRVLAVFWLFIPGEISQDPDKKNRSCYFVVLIADPN